MVTKWKPLKCFMFSSYRVVNTAPELPSSNFNLRSMVVSNKKVSSIIQLSTFSLLQNLKSLFVLGLKENYSFCLWLYAGNDDAVKYTQKIERSRFKLSSFNSAYKMQFSQRQRQLKQQHQKHAELSWFINTI